MAESAVVGAADVPRAGTPAEPADEVMARVQRLVAEGKTIQAVKELRQHAGLGLEEAQDIVDRLRAQSRSATARSASSYDASPKPAIVPVATPATTLVCRNSSRAAGLEMCTSTSGARSWAHASRSA